MKRLFYFILTLSIVMVTSACTSSVKQEKMQLIKELEVVKEENFALEAKVTEFTKQIEDLKGQITALKEDLEGLKNGDVDAKDLDESRLKIYTADVNTYEREEVSSISVTNDLSLEDKLDMLAGRLSKDVFDGLGIDVIKIDIIHGKKVAVVNLSENSNAQGATWNTMYFQGSAGGAITSISLSDTFLQDEYHGEWIDGVKFLYNNQNIEFDHVEGLSEAKYR